MQLLIELFEFQYQSHIAVALQNVNDIVRCKPKLLFQVVSILFFKIFVKEYDFILLPWYFYNKVSKGIVDVFANFMSLQEMGRRYFEYYLKQEPFLSARIFFTMNRYQSAPTYDNGLTILDYPLGDFTRLHFATMPLGQTRYRRKNIFFYAHFSYPSQHFEFVGRRQ